MTARPSRSGITEAHDVMVAESPFETYDWVMLVNAGGETLAAGLQNGDVGVVQAVEPDGLETLLIVSFLGFVNSAGHGIWTVDPGEVVKVELSATLARQVSHADERD